MVGGSKEGLCTLEGKGFGVDKEDKVEWDNSMSHSSLEALDRGVVETELGVEDLKTPCCTTHELV